MVAVLVEVEGPETLCSLAMVKLIFIREGTKESDLNMEREITEKMQKLCYRLYTRQERPKVKFAHEASCLPNLLAVCKSFIESLVTAIEVNRFLNAKRYFTSNLKHFEV